MTDTVVRSSTVQYLSDAALLTDLTTLHHQLEYADAFDDTEALRAGPVTDRVGGTWSALQDEARRRGLID